MTKLTALTELTAVDPADLLYIVDDPAGTPTGKKATALNVVSDTLANAGAAIDFSDGLTVAGGSNGINASGALTAASATVNGDLTVDTNSLHVDSSNNRVGIGTTSPDTQLHIRAVEPQLKMYATGGSNTAAIMLDADSSVVGGGLAGFYGYWDSNLVAQMLIRAGADTANKDDGKIDFRVASGGALNTAIRIESNTNVGINQTSPSAQLHVANSDATQPALRIDAAAGQTSHIFAVNDNNGNDFFLVDYDGTIEMGGDKFRLPNEFNMQARNAANSSWLEMLRLTGSDDLVVGQNVARIYIRANGADAAKFDDNATAGNTRFTIYDVDNGTLSRVSVGAADSGGSGYKVLRIPN